MVSIKTPQQIATMQRGGQLLHQIKEKVAAAAQPGVTPKELDALADKLLHQTGGQPSFKTVPGYHHATCINVNSGIVHGIPTDTPLKKGDHVTIDMGLLYQGFHTDTSISVGISKISPEKNCFLATGRQALHQAIQQAKAGNRIGHISQAIEKVLTKKSYSPVSSLTGHGIGRKLHQPPFIPCLLQEPLTQTPKIKTGMVLAIEVIYAAGSPELRLLPDGWTITTKDDKIAAVYEETVAVTKNGPLILT